MLSLDTPADMLDHDEDFAELDSLLNPPPKLVPDAADARDEDLDELEALLGSAMEEKRVADYVKQARTKARQGYQLSPEDQARIEVWSLAREWLPVANVALFHRYHCKCGGQQIVFEGLLLEQASRHNKSANRWTAQTEEVPGLPKKSATRLTRTEVCPCCMGGRGYSLEGALEWKA